MSNYNISEVRIFLGSNNNPDKKELLKNILQNSLLGAVNVYYCKRTGDTLIRCSDSLDTEDLVIIEPDGLFSCYDFVDTYITRSSNN